jgi:hypothetical protein
MIEKYKFNKTALAFSLLIVIPSTLLMIFLLTSGGFSYFPSPYGINIIALFGFVGGITSIIMNVFWKIEPLKGYFSLVFIMGSVYFISFPLFMLIPFEFLAMLMVFVMPFLILTVATIYCAIKSKCIRTTVTLTLSNPMLYLGVAIVLAFVYFVPV